MVVDTYTLLKGLARRGPAIHHRYMLSGIVQALREVNTPKTAAYVEYITIYHPIQRVYDCLVGN